MRSTADRTFLSTAGSKYVPIAHEERRTHNSEIITERFNYVEDNVPVEKEVVTKITRGGVAGHDSRQEKSTRTEERVTRLFTSHTERPT